MHSSTRGFVCDVDVIEIFDGMEVGSFHDYFMALEVLVDFDGGE